MKFKWGRLILVILLISTVIYIAFKITYKNNDNKNVIENVSEEIIYKDNIRLGISNFDTINPITTRNKEMIYINQLIYEPLLNLDKEYKLQPCIATEYAKTGVLTYIVKIDNTIKWSNGTNITTNDIKYTVNLLKTVENIYSENVKNISNVEAIDDSTLKITLNEEVPFFEYNLIFPIMCENNYLNEDFFSTAKYPIGTGRYKIVSVNNDEILLEKNENYRGNVNNNIEKIRIGIFSEIGEVYNSFKIGNTDIINTSSLIYKNHIGTIGYYLKSYSGREYDFLSCNCDDVIMKEKSVRQAINFAIDKDNIISSVFNNEYYKSEYMLDFGSYVYNGNISNYSYNTEKAKEILANAGWVHSNNIWKKNGRTLSITISVNSSNKNRCEVAKIIKSQLESIGIIVNIRELSDGQYNYCLQNKNYQILLTGVYNGYSPDLTYFYGENNISNYKNEEVTSILNEIKNITDSKVLQEKYKKIIQVTQEECAYISLYRNKCSLIIRQEVLRRF